MCRQHFLCFLYSFAELFISTLSCFKKQFDAFWQENLILEPSKYMKKSKIKLVELLPQVSYSSLILVQH